MDVYISEGILYMVPDTDLVADRFDELRSFFLDALKQHNKERIVVLDANGIDFIDSLGVNLIIGLFKELDNTSRSFKIINANEKFMKVANFFKFPAIFPVESAESES